MAILAKNYQIYKKALQKIHVTDIGIGSYAITDVNEISSSEDLNG